MSASPRFLRSCALLAIVAACGGVSVRTADSIRPSGISLAPSQRYHPKMSAGYGLRTTCDGIDVPVRRLISWVGRPASGRVAAMVHVLAIGAPRWNTANGRRPTQAESDAMVDEREQVPSIFRPVTLRLDRVLAGSTSLRKIVAFAESGRIGEDGVSSCAFGSVSGLQIREGPGVVTIGADYVAILGDEMPTGRADGPLEMPMIDNLFVVQGNRVVGSNGISEPVP